MSTTKQAFKIGDMIIDQKQIFWKMQYCYALIPVFQPIDGRNPALLPRGPRNHHPPSPQFHLPRAS